MVMKPVLKSNALNEGCDRTIEETVCQMMHSVTAEEVLMNLSIKISIIRTYAEN